MNLLILLFLNGQAQELLASHRPKAMTLGKGSYEFRIPTSFFMSSGYFDEQGNGIPLDYPFYALNTGLSGDYYVGNNLMFGFDLNFRFNMVSSETFDYAGNFQSASASAHYFFKPMGSLYYSLFIKPRIMLNPNPTKDSNETMDLGVAGTELSLGLDISNRFAGNHIVTGSVSYEPLKPDGLSPTVSFNLESAWPYKHWALYFGVNGQLALYDTDLDSSILSFGTASGEISGTRYYGLYNQSYVGPFLGINFLFNTLRLDLKYENRVFGMNTDSGHLLELTLTNQHAVKVNYYTNKNAKLKEYAITADITEVSKNDRFLKINKGLINGVNKGTPVDVYTNNLFGESKLVAEGVVFKVNSKQAIVRVSKKFAPVKLTNKLVVRMN